MDLKTFLDTKVEKYNRPEFIQDDPISIPHQFSKKKDIEISGFFAATLAWGQRKTIISKGKELMKLMDNSPHDFILHHKEKDLKQLLKFNHRTFNTTDLLYFIEFFKNYYQKNNSLEDAFASLPTPLQRRGGKVENSLINFHNLFFSLEDFPKRTQKHIATPLRKSTCKRLNMFLRWMVRNDDKGVDFGIWKKIKPSQLICPIDLHVDRVARKFGLIKRKQTDWLTALELTDNLRKFDKQDPVKYDFALFGISASPLSPLQWRGEEEKLFQHH